MSISKALEIEKIKPVQNGIYVCTDAKNKKFELIKLEKIPIKVSGKEFLLGNFLKTILDDFKKTKENLTMISDKHNELLEAFKRKTIMDAIPKI